MEELFELIKNYGFIIRKNNLDGLASWNELKAFLSTISCEKLEWTIEIVKNDDDTTFCLQNAYNYVHDTLGMKGEETDPKDENWEKFHFFLQLVRIPKNNKCDLVRLAQIAYNLGQLSAVYDDAVYTIFVKQFYDKNKLDKLRTYTKSSCDISPDNLKTINRFIENKKTGAGYLHKYKKYKKKYLKFKNNL